MHLIRIIVALLLAALFSLPAVASGLSGFTTPSGNIACYVEAGQLVCEIRETAWTPSAPVPKDCELDSGKQIQMTTTSKPKGTWWCRGDTWLDVHIKPLAYGTVWEKDGFYCASEPSGLTCRNAAGHGWRMSKQSVEIIPAK